MEGYYQGMDMVSPRERRILEMKYIEKEKWAKIADDFGVTPTRVKQVSDNAILKLMYIKIKK